MRKEVIESYKKKSKEIVSKMTLSEKVSQLRHHSKAIPKYNIEKYNWWNECLHGVARAGLATIFPQAIAMASTFSEDIMYKVGDIISTEARAKHHEFVRNGKREIYQGLNFWTPNINIYRDPRWGRGQETYGEDPILTSNLGVAFIKGLQGDNGEYMKALACAKHFAVHSGPEGERHSINVKVNKKDLHETYLYAFKRAVIDAKVEAVMAAYNMVNDESCCASKTLLEDILRGEWGFDGHVVSDCGGLFDIMLKHKATLNPLKAVSLAIKSGLDLECGTFYSILPLAVKFGVVSEEYVDKSVERLLVARMKLGMFDSNCPYNSIPYSENAKKEHEDYAITVAEKAMVLLKNDGILPLKENSDSKIGLFGYNATNEIAYLGNYFGTPSSFITLKDAFSSVENLVYSYAFGKEKRTKESDREFEKSIDLAKSCDIVVLATGLDSTMEGEAGDTGAGAEGIIGEQGDRESINLPKNQLDFIDRLHKLGKKIIVCNFSGGAVSFESIERKVSAILQCWYPGAKGGKAIYNILFGKVNPSGRLPLTFYKSDDDLGDFRDYNMTNKTYRYFKGEPMYSFGYGLSYSNFEYNGASIARGEDSITIDFEVKNVSNIDGDEVCEVYIKYLDDMTQPLIKFLASKRVFIKANSTQKVSIDIRKDAILGYNDNGEQIVVSGNYKIYVGGSQPKYSKVLEIDTKEKDIF